MTSTLIIGRNEKFRHPCFQTISQYGQLASHQCGFCGRRFEQIVPPIALGNAVVPQCAEFIGRCLVEFDRRR